MQNIAKITKNIANKKGIYRSMFFLVKDSHLF